LAVRVAERVRLPWRESGGMKNTVWLGGLLLALAAGSPHLTAQEVQWSPAVNSLAGSPASRGATLGRPEPLRINPSPPPANLPRQPDILPINFEIGQTEDVPAASAGPRETLRRPPEVIAVSATEPSADADEGADEENVPTLFASERPLIPVTAQRSVRPAPQPNLAVVPVDWTAPAAPVPVVQGADPDYVPAVDPLKKCRFYVSGEYLLWWLKGENVPVLATTSAPADLGILGRPTTSVLFGGSQINQGPFSGGRFTAGYWLDMWGEEALEVSGFFLGPQTTNFSANSSTYPVIARPFFGLNANINQVANLGSPVNQPGELSQLTTFPGSATGSLTIRAPTSLWGVEGNFRWLLCCGCCYRVTAIAGFRNVNLDDSLAITENIQGLATASPPLTNSLITVFDQFSTSNHFYGGQVGIDGRYYWGRWSVDAWGKLALGGTVQQVDINGGQNILSLNTGQVTHFQGGLLALPNANIGHFIHDAFSVVPEVGLNVGYQITPRLRGFVAYNFLFWNNVLRAGDQIDRNLDITKIPNFTAPPGTLPIAGTHPTVPFRESNLWAQGISFGLEFTY
jgi:hypothetical protein